jgi:hypothetical protein
MSVTFFRDEYLILANTAFLCIGHNRIVGEIELQFSTISNGH